MPCSSLYIQERHCDMYGHHVWFSTRTEAIIMKTHDISGFKEKMIPNRTPKQTKNAGIIGCNTKQWQTLFTKQILFY